MRDSPARITLVAVGFGTVWSPRANWKITGIEMCGAQPSGLPGCCAHSELSRYSWIAAAPGIVSISSSGRFRSGSFSMKFVGNNGLFGYPRVEERRRPGHEGVADERPEARREPCDLDDRTAGDVRHAGADRRLEAENLDAVDAAERLTGVVDARGAQVGMTRRR